MAAGVGCAVTVVSEFGGASVKDGQMLSPDVRAAPVLLPSRLLVPFLVSIKRVVTRHLLAQSPADKGPSDHVPATSAFSGRGIGESLRDYLLSLLNVIDAYKRWAFCARQKAIEIARSRGSRLIIVSGPPYSGVVAAWAASRRLRIPLIVDFRDPFWAGRLDDAPYGFVERALRRVLERFVICEAVAVTTASPGIAEALRKRFPEAAAKIQVVLNGFDIEPIQRSIKTNHRLNILFAGAIYVNRNPFPFLEALEAVLARPSVDPERICVTFVGDCSTYRGRSLAEWLQGKRAGHCVTLAPAVSHEELEPYMRAATVLLNFAQGQQRMIPAKTFEQLASGVEMLTLCEADSDTGRLLDGITGVTRIAPADQPALEAALQGLYDRHVVKGEMRSVPAVEVARFSRHGQNKKILLLIQKLLPELEPAGQSVSQSQ